MLKRNSNGLILDDKKISIKRDLKVNDRLIISIDVKKKSQVVGLCKNINNKVSTLKIGLELIYSIGPDIIDIVRSFGYKVLLDAKLFDIPNTVLGAVSAISGYNVDMITIHTLGGYDMLKKAKDFLMDIQNKRKKISPLLFGVTILTSLDSDDLKALGFSKGYLSSVLNLAKIARDANLDGVICSPNEVGIIREKFGKNFYIATPGIRLPDDKKEDQKRTSTPENAILEGADFIIVGRSITKKENVGESADKFLGELKKVIRKKKDFN